MSASRQALREAVSLEASSSLSFAKRLEHVAGKVSHMKAITTSTTTAIVSNVNPSKLLQRRRRSTCPPTFFAASLGLGVLGDAVRPQGPLPHPPKRRGSHSSCEFAVLPSTDALAVSTHTISTPCAPASHPHQVDRLLWHMGMDTDRLHESASTSASASASAFTSSTTPGSTMALGSGKGHGAHGGFDQVDRLLGHLGLGADGGMMMGQASAAHPGGMMGLVGQSNSAFHAFRAPQHPPSSPGSISSSSSSSSSSVSSAASAASSSSSYFPYRPHNGPPSPPPSSTPTPPSHSHSPAHPHSSPSSFLEADYRVNEVVGEGGFGVVRRVTCRTTGADKAVKTCDAGAAVQLEVDLLRRIGPHPHTMNIEAVYIENSSSSNSSSNSCNHSNYTADDATDRRQVHIVSDLFGGGDLFDHISKASPNPPSRNPPSRNPSTTPQPFACCIRYI